MAASRIHLRSSRASAAQSARQTNPFRTVPVRYSSRELLEIFSRHVVLNKRQPVPARLDCRCKRKFARVVLPFSVAPAGIHGIPACQLPEIRHADCAPLVALHWNPFGCVQPVVEESTRDCVFRCCVPVGYEAEPKYKSLSQTSSFD